MSDANPESIPIHVDGSGADDPGDVVADAVASSTKPSPSVKTELESTPVLEIWNNCEPELFAGEITQNESVVGSYVIPPKPVPSAVIAVTVDPAGTIWYSVEFPLPSLPMPYSESLAES